MSIGDNENDKLLSSQITKIFANFCGPCDGRDPLF